MIINNIIGEQEIKTLLDRVGKYLRDIDITLLGKHTYILYNSLKQREASILAQL